MAMKKPAAKKAATKTAAAAGDAKPKFGTPAFNAKYGIGKGKKMGKGK